MPFPETDNYDVFALPDQEVRVEVPPLAGSKEGNWVATPRAIAAPDEPLLVEFFNERKLKCLVEAAVGVVQCVRKFLRGGWVNEHVTRNVRIVKILL